MGFEDRYYSYLVAADIEGAWTYLQSLTDDERREATAWFGRSRIALVDRVQADAPKTDLGEYDPRPSSVAPWILALGPIALLGPVTAARKIPWRRLWWARDDDTVVPFLVDRLCGKDRAWTAAFVEEASAVRVARGGHTLAMIVRSVATHHQLPCPSGDTFLENWTAGVPEMSQGWDHATRTVIRDPAGWLGNDPFMPDLLLQYLASGHCGSSDWLPGTIPTLVERGKVQREEIVQHVLAQLTAPQRPAAQKVLVQILQALRLQAAEVRGGCAYFLGVIATSKGVVGKLFLPMALETVRSREDLDELVAIVAGRSEKVQKNVLLNGLKMEDLRERVGVDAVRAALEVLASVDDAAFAQKVRAVLDQLPGATGEGQAENVAELQPSGLWDLPPTPSGAPDEGGRPVQNPTWAEVLDSRAFAADMWRQSALIDTVLGAMADGTFDQAAALKQITVVLGAARLSMSTTVTVFRDLFSSGGLKQGFPLALEVAEVAAGLTKKQPGTADLFRLLAEFAVEIPPSERPPLPSNLFGVVTSANGTKAVAEARVLGARLSGLPVDTYVAGLVDRTDPRPSPRRRGLWKEPAESTLASTLLPALDTSLVGKLLDHMMLAWATREISGGFGSRPLQGTPGRGVGFCGPDLLVSAVVRSVIPVGLDRVRKPFAALPGGEAWLQRDVNILALAEWAEGRVDASVYWRLALDARTAETIRREFVDRKEDWSDSDRREFEVRLWDRLSAVAFDGAGPRGEPLGLVLTWILNDPAARLAFVRTLEVLLLSPENPVVLSTPVWADGTLDLDTLLIRLRAAEGRPIGPLDLVQALHRLRHCPPERARDIEELASSGGTWRTARALTDPHGVESWDVLDAVHTWIAAGGLPPLNTRVSADGGWVTDAAVPVPWSRCLAAPAEVRAGTWSLSPQSGPVLSARVHPLWPDRLVPIPGHTADPDSFPAEMSGSFDLPLQAGLLDLLVRGIERRDSGCLAAAHRAVRRGKVDRDLFTRAVLTQADVGALNVGRLAQATQHLFEQDCLAQFWAPALQAAEALVARPGPPPRGLVQLVEVLTAYAHEVPGSFVPPALRALAEASGRTKLDQVVRTLVDALGHGGTR